MTDEQKKLLLLVKRIKAIRTRGEYKIKLPTVVVGVRG